MLIKEGVAPASVIGSLHDLITQLENVASTWGAGADAWQFGQNSYLQVAETMETVLRNWFDDDDGVGAGVYGGNYRLVRDMTQDSPRPYPLVRAEVDRQVRALTALQAKLNALQSLQDRPGALAVLDTNVLMHYQRLDEIPWAEVVGVAPVRIILPICVIDELDNKKYTGSDRMSRRADLAVRVLRQYSELLRPGNAATLPDGTTIEILLDEPRHERLPNPDEELLARCLLLLRAIGRQLTVITGDLGMQLRADATGLTATEVPERYAKDATRRAQVDNA